MSVDKLIMFGSYRAVEVERCIKVKSGQPISLIKPSIVAPLIPYLQFFFFFLQFYRQLSLDNVGI